MDAEGAKTMSRLRKRLLLVIVCAAIAASLYLVSPREMIGACRNQNCICGPTGREPACNGCNQNAGWDYNYQGTRCSEDCQYVIHCPPNICCDCRWTVYNVDRYPGCNGFYDPFAQCAYCTDYCQGDFGGCPCEFV